ncbi:MAG: FAD/NAD(P)-binding oxidoreductase [Bacteroidota bacterium]
MNTKETISHKIVIIGGGTAGITVAARLLNHDSKLDVAIIEPSDKHYYQPAFTLVGAGTYDMQSTIREEKQYIPDRATWIKDRATAIDPDEQTVSLGNGDTVKYEYLVVAPGIQLNWDAMPGLEDAIGKNGVTSNYDPRYAEYTWELLRNFQGGNAVFTQPGTPIKCGGAPQKIMYLAEDYFRKQGIRDKSNVLFATPGTVIFGVEEFANVLNGIIADRDIIIKLYHEPIELRPDKKEIVFKITAEKENWDSISVNDESGQSGEVITDATSVIPYDMLHVVPPQSAPDFIRNGPLVHQEGDHKGWVNVDIHTLQHNEYPNVFSLGDSAALPTAKTGAAVRKQAPVVVENLLSVMNNQEATNDSYTGYSSCPLVTQYGKMLLAEFDYDNNPMPSVPVNTFKERRDMWYLKKYVLPFMYWHFMLKGRA